MSGASFRTVLSAHRHRPMVRGAILSVLLMGIGTGVGYAVQIVISRTLGASEYGTYAYVLGLLNIVRTVVTVSFDIAALRFVGVYHTGGDWPHFRGFVLASRCTVGLFSICGALICAAGCLFWQDRLPPGLLHPLLAACLLLVPSSLLILEVALLQALRRVYEARIPNAFLRPMLLAGVLTGAVYLFGSRPSASLALHANTAGVVLALAISVWLLRRLVPTEARSAPKALQRREWSLFCVINLGQSLVYLLLSQQADIVIVGSLISTKEAGLYAAASQVSALCLLGVTTVNQFAAPLLAEFHDRHSDERLKRLLARTMLLNAALSMPLVVVVVGGGSLLLGMFGAGFSAAYPVIVILSAGNVVNALWGGQWGDLLSMTGLQNESALIVIAVTILNLALTVLLTPRLGMQGAAVATTAAVLVRSVLVAAVVRVRFGFYPWTVLRHAAA